MFGSRGSNFADNAKLIRLNAERCAQLEELGKQINSLVDRMNEIVLPETT